MLQWTRRERASRPRHEAGEVVLADLGNYLEAAEDGRSCQPKMRPVILLRIGDCQHLVAGLTTQSRHLTTGAARPLVPASDSMGLLVTSFLWSDRPSRISRINVRRHVGWVDRAVVEFLADHFPTVVAGGTFTSLWQAAVAHAGGVE